MVQIRRRGTARRFFENFKKFSKITEFEFQDSGPSFFVSVSPVYCKKIDSIRTKLTEEIHFEVCHSGNLPPIVACRGSAGGMAAGVHQQSTTDVWIQKCFVRITPWFRSGGIRNWGHNRVVKTNWLVCVSVCLSE